MRPIRDLNTPDSRRRRMRDTVVHRHVKMLTPPGPTSIPSTTSSTPCASRRRASATTPATTSPTARIQSSNATPAPIVRVNSHRTSVALAFDRDYTPRGAFDCNRYCSPTITSGATRIGHDSREMDGPAAPNATSDAVATGASVTRMVTAVHEPVRLALVDDYDVILAGVAHLFDQYTDRITVVELDANRPVSEDVDVALFDAFAQLEVNEDLATLIRNPRAAHVAVYTWNFRPALIREALDMGASGYLSKALPAREMVAALEAIRNGQVVVSEAPTGTRLTTGLDWPGREEGLSERESEVLALITQGKTNAAIAELTFLSINSIKSYIRSAYRKIGVTSRVEAVLWGVEHGFLPNYHRIDTWQPGPDL